VSNYSYQLIWNTCIFYNLAKAYTESDEESDEESESESESDLGSQTSSSEDEPTYYDEEIDVLNELFPEVRQKGHGILRPGLDVMTDEVVRRRRERRERRRGSSERRRRRRELRESS